MELELMAKLKVEFEDEVKGEDFSNLLKFV